MQKSVHYNVVIIGGGPAGSSCALKLAQLGIQNILMIESSNFEKFRIGESIPPETNHLFQELNILADFKAEKHDPCYGSCSFWGDDRRGYNDSLLSPYRNGWHLDRARFNQFLTKKAQEQGVEFQTNTTFKGAIKLGNNQYQLNINQAGEPQTITANIVVDASGARGIFAKLQGSQKINTLPLVCLCLRFTRKNKEQILSKLTHLEAVEYGWWYAAQLPNDAFLVALYTDATIVKTNQLNQTKKWLHLLLSTPNTRKLIDGLKLLDKELKGFPAPSFRLDEVSGDNWLAVGDAATAYDPITSQGITKAMTNGIFAAELIAQKLKNEIADFEIYNQTIAQQYEQYLSMRAYFYEKEQRWAGSYFWGKYQTN